jgi:hypothetical protein
MPSIGDPARFAIEYELDPDHGGQWLLGRFCYWCGGIRVGDYELGTSLRDVLFRLERIHGEAGRRMNPRFVDLPAEQVHALLSAALFGSGAPVEPAVVDDEQWARHLLLPAVDVFDAWRAYLVQATDRERLISVHLPSARVSEVVLRPGEVDEVLQLVIEDLGARLVRETAVESKRPTDGR